MKACIARWLVWLGTWLQVKFGPAQAPTSPTESVVLHACGNVGLNAEGMTCDSDLSGTGKLYDVLHLSARLMGKNHELRTVSDVVAWLDEAPVAK